MALSEVIGKQLQEGRNVRKDDLGTFSLTLQGTVAVTNELLGKANSKGAIINYNPSKKLKSKINSLLIKEYDRF